MGNVNKGIFLFCSSLCPSVCLSHVVPIFSCQYCNVYIYYWGLLINPESLVLAFASMQVFGLAQLASTEGFASGELCTGLAACLPGEWECLHAASCSVRSTWMTSDFCQLHPFCTVSIQHHCAQEGDLKPFSQEDLFLNKLRAKVWSSLGQNHDAIYEGHFPPFSQLRSYL